MTMLRLSLVMLVVLLAAPAGAQDALESSDVPATAAKAQVNGYLSQRVTYQHVTPDVPVATRDLPSLATLTEANVQLKVNLGAGGSFAYADLSLVYQGGWLFYEDDGAGGKSRVPDHDVVALHPAVVPSELYVSLSPKLWLNVLLGKKRITWGAGFAFNPTDLINPPKDPTDPNYQRAGNWLARVELPLERFTVSALFAPQALYSQSGLPYAFMRYPDYAPATGADTRDQTSHYLLAGRLYALLANTDVNLIYYFSNAYQDAFRDKSRLGLSFSRYFFVDYELHVEALLARGSARNFPIHDCVADQASCAGTPFAASKADSTAFYPRVIAGARRMFSDESLLSVEYYYQRDGYSDQEFADAIALQAIAKSLPSATGATGSALPQRYAFDPLRRHYLILSYSKPRIADDWTAGAVLIAGLRDLSGVFSPSVSWSTCDWLTLGLYGFVPIHGLGVGEARVGDDSFSEYGLSPYAFRVLFEARGYY
jgi:hypothetical protein